MASEDLSTYKYICFATQSLPIVVSCDDLKHEVGPPHVMEEHGCFDQPCICFHHESFFSFFDGWDDEPVCHGTIIASIFVSSLGGGKTQVINNQAKNDFY